MQGERLGPYQIDRELGSGAMGTVYEAHDEDGNRVAIKLVHPHLLTDTGAVDRFLREAEIGRGIDHPNVVRTLDAGEHEGRPYLVLEFVLGGTLHELRLDLHRVPETLCRHIGREAANGLDAIHAQGIVHRDIKPENILITPEHEVRLMDLGLARAASGADRLTVTGHFAGTPAYCPPEQFHGKVQLDERSDLYSLGATLYELATGQPPFSADSLPALVRMVMDEAPPRPGQLCTQLSPFFEEVLLSLLEKDPERRIPTAAKLARVLEAGERSDWWSVQATLIVAETRRPLRRIRIPRETECVGRDDDLASLRAAFDAAKEGDGRVILLEGEAGIGKSRLIDELMRRLEAAGEDVNFLFGSYPPGGGATAVGAFSTAYGEQFGNEGCARYLTETPVLAPAFDALLRGDATPPGAHPLTSDSLKTVLVHATRALGRERPTVVVIDDLHFAPDEGRELFASLAAAVPGHPILLVGTARPGLPKEWYANLERLDHVSRSQVTRLGPDDVSQLLEPVIGASLQAERLATSIAATADGNPFFLFEIVRSLRESGVLTKTDDGSWSTTSRISEISLPDTVQSLLDARIERLSADERELLDCAACWGFRFDGRLVAEALGMRRLAALRLFGGLEQQHGLVRAAGSEFVFDHHAIQEHLRARLAGAMREELHAALAEALEARIGAAGQDPEMVDGELCAQLCEHYLAGARGHAALRYLNAAQAHLRSRYLHAQAVALADRALAVPGLLTRVARVRALLKLGWSLRTMGRSARQEECAREAERVAEEAGDTSSRAEAARLLGQGFLHTGRLDEADDAFRRAREFARAVGDRKTEAEATGNIGNVAYRRGRLAEATAHFEHKLAVSREIGNRLGEASALGNLGNLHFSEGRLPEAREHYEQHLALAREGGDRRMEVIATSNLGIVLKAEGRLAEAREHHRQGLEVSREIGDRWCEAHSAASLGTTLWCEGRFADARGLHERRLAISREIGARDEAGDAYGMLGILSKALGDLPGARAYNEALLELSRELGDKLWKAIALHNLGGVLVEQGEAERGAEFWAECLSLARGNELGAVAAATHRVTGSLLALRGDVDGARQSLVAAADAADGLGEHATVALARCELALLPGGDVHDAVATLEEHKEQLSAEDRREAHWLLWRATGDRTHLAEAKRLLDESLALNPDQHHEAMCSQLRLNREILAAWREEFGGDDPGAGSPTA